MEDIRTLTEKMRKETPASFENLPDLDLYMDQVLAFLSRQHISFREEDKLTSAMINNYKKIGLLPRTKGKKYTREHLVYLTLIARLKQVLSVKDTNILLKEGMKGNQPSSYYENFLLLLDDSLNDLHKETEDFSENSLSYVALRLALSAYTNKIACEHILDEIERKNLKSE